MAPDSTVPHLEATLDADWHEPPATVAMVLARMRPGRCGVAGTAHRSFALGTDYAIHGDRTRTERYLTAIQQIDQWAMASVPLTWSRMCELQEVLLGRPVAFRTGNAFAKRGAERYGWWPDLRELFIAKIEQDQGDASHPVLQACRAYLDLIYVHPFENGNARAARLWMQYLLGRAGYPMPDMTELHRLPKSPGDARRYWSFALVTAKLVAKSQREAR